MSRPLGLSVAGLCFELSSARVTDLAEVELAYRPFLGEVAASPANVRVEVEVGRQPKLSSFEPVLDTGQSWILSRDADGFVWFLRRSDHSEPYCSCRLRLPEERVEIVASREFYEALTRRSDPLGPFRYPLDQLVFCHLLAHRETGMLVHAAGLVLEDRSVLFPGRSGAGKSTLSRHLSVSPSATLVSDDRMAVTHDGSTFTAWGTPWCGEAGYSENLSRPLGALYFLEHGPCNRATPLGEREILESLLPVTSIPWYDRALAENTVDLCGRLARSVPCYRMEFVPDERVAYFLHDALTRTGG